MKNRTATLSAFAALLLFYSPAFSCALPFSAGSCGFASCKPGMTVLAADSCPAPANIKIEILQAGDALITWDDIPGVPKYYVKIVDENGNVVVDTIANTNKFLAGGLIKGKKYTVTVCYLCTRTGERICSFKSFRYIIIEDQVVMFDGSNGCNCKQEAGIEGLCTDSQSPHYSLETPRIYNIRLIDDTQISIVCKNTVNPAGNCQLDFEGMGFVEHGDNNSFLPFYEIGNSVLFFHGSTFCIQGAAAESVTYCNIKTEKDRSAVDVVSPPVYPNPFSDMLLVDLPSDHTTGTEIRLQLFNATGQLMMEEHSISDTQFSLQTSSLLPGLYWLRLGSGSKTLYAARVLKL